MVQSVDDGGRGERVKRFLTNSRCIFHNLTNICYIVLFEVGQFMTFFVKIDQIIGQKDMINILRLQVGHFVDQIVGHLARLSIFSIKI